MRTLLTLSTMFLLVWWLSVACSSNAERVAERLPEKIILHRTPKLKYCKMIWVDSTGVERTFLIDSTNTF